MSLSLLLPAIKTKAEAIGALSALGTLYFDEVPEVSSFPWWTYSQVSGINNRAFGTRYFDQIRIQFSIYHTDKRAIEATYFPALLTNFDNGSITLSGTETCIECARPMPPRVVKVRGMVDKNSNAVYMGHVDYLIKVDQAW